VNLDKLTHSRKPDPEPPPMDTLHAHQASNKSENSITAYVQAIVEISSITIELTVLLDTGANPRSYISTNLVKDSFNSLPTVNVNRSVNLGGSDKDLRITRTIMIPITLVGPSGKKYAANVDFDIIESKINMIIGLHDISRNFHKLVIELLEMNHLHAKKEDENKDTWRALNASNLLNSIIDDNPIEGNQYDPWLQPYNTPDEDREIEELDIFPQINEEDFMKREDDYKRGISAQIHSTNEEEKNDVLNVLMDRKYREIFVWKTWRYMNIPKIKLKWKEGMPSHHSVAPRPVPPTKQEEAEKSFARFKKYGFWKQADLAPRYTTPVVLVWKGDGSIRVCADYPSFVNKWLIPCQTTSPNLTMELEKLKNYSRFLNVDIKEAFHTLGITESDAEKLTVATHEGNYTPTAIPMGITVGSALLQEVAQRIFSKFKHRAIVMQDNLIIGITKEENAAEVIRDLLDECISYNITLNWKKCDWLEAKTQFWGYDISENKYTIAEARKQGISTYLYPHNQKAAQRFCGFSNFFAPFIPNFRDLIDPILPLLRNDYKHKDAVQQTDAFTTLKERMKTTMDLFIPNREAQWILRTDANDNNVAAILMQRVSLMDSNAVGTTGQEDTDTQLQPLALMSKPLSTTAKENWHTHTKELYAIIISLKQFSDLIDSQPLLIETDHRNLLYAQSNTNPMTLRWIRYAQANYNITAIIHRSGIRNTVADAMSRISALSASKLDKLLDTSDAKIEDTIDWLFVCEIPSPSQEKKEEAQASLSSIANLLPEEAFRQVHNARNGHFGWHKTYNLLRLHHPETRISSEAVRQFVSDCPTCQKYRTPNSNTKNKEVLHAIPIRTTHGLVTADTFKMPKDDYNNTHILVIINHLTKMIDLKALNSKDSSNIVKALYEHMCDNGVPEQILTDPGSEFNNNDMESLAQWLGLVHTFSIAKRPQGHGTERSIGKTKMHLGILLGSENITERWSDRSVLPAIKLIMNNTINLETNAIPFHLRYGTLAATAYDKFDSRNDASAATELIQTLDQNLSILTKKSIEYQQLMKNSRMRKGLDRNQEHKFIAGDFILWRSDNNFRPGGGLTAKLLGPFKVVSQNNNIIIATHLSSGRPCELHHDRCILATSNETLARELARQDYPEEEIIHSITQHRGSVDTKQTTTYRTVYNTGHVAWLPYVDVCNTVAFSDYANSKRCTRIPLLSTVEVLRRLKREASSHEIPTLSRLGEIPPVGAIVYISTHILTTDDIDVADLPYQDTTEYVMKGKVAAIHRKRIDINIPLLQVTLAMTLFRYRCYVQEHTEENQEILTESILPKEVLQRIRQGLC